MPNALGTEGHGERILAVTWDTVQAWAAAPNWWPLVLAMGVAVHMLAIGRRRPASLRC